jgi:hypothetical protein
MLSCELAELENLFLPFGPNQQAMARKKAEKRKAPSVEATPEPAPKKQKSTKATASKGIASSHI